MTEQFVRPFRPNDKKISWTHLQFDIELTERCNNRCIHCYINQPADDAYIKAREMDTAFIKDILHQAADLNFLSVRFTGGEPLLRDDFEELYLFARRLGLRVMIFTNARLITPRLAQLFSRYLPGKMIEVSVYGMHPASYDAVAAARGAYQEFRRGVDRLLAHKIPFLIKHSLLPQNMDEFSELEAFAAELPHMAGDIPAVAMNFDLRARRDDPVKNERIRRLRLSPQETLQVLKQHEKEYREGMRQMAGMMHPPGDKLFPCDAGVGKLSIDAYGNAQMCLQLRHPDTTYPLDPVLHQKNHPKTALSPLAYALTEFFPRVREMRATNPDYLRRCAVCFLKAVCEQCAAKSWQEHGTLDTPVEYLCEVTHVQAVDLGLLSEGEKSWNLSPKEWKARLNAFTHLAPSE